jgi:hypothetical protein
MTRKTPVSTVLMRLADGTEYPLEPLPGCTITLDESTEYHVQGSLTVATPGDWAPDAFGQPQFTVNSAAVAALDAKRAVRIITDIYPDGLAGTLRRFDLGLREVTPEYGSGVIRLDVASDEATLQDWGPLTDDSRPLDMHDSIRGVVSYVIAKCQGNKFPDTAPGLYLDGWESVTNAGTVTMARGFNEGGEAAASSPHSARVTLVSGTPSSWGVQRTATAVAGRTYSARAEMRSFTAGKFFTVRMDFLDGGGAAIAGAGASGGPYPSVAEAWVHGHVTAIAPAGTASVRVRAWHTSWVGPTSSSMDVTGMTVGEGVTAPQVLAPGNTDTDIQAAWAATNYILNPQVTNSATNWAGGAATIVRSANAGPNGASGYIAATSSASIYHVYPQATDTAADAPRRVTPGDVSYSQAHVKAPTAMPNMRMRHTYRNAAGKIIEEVDTPAQVPSTFWFPIELMTTAPAGADTIQAHLWFSGASGQVVHVDQFMLTDAWEAPTGQFPRVEYFDGSNGPTQGPTYSVGWAGQANATPSTRTPLVERPPESFTWRAGQSGMDFLRGHVQAAGYRLVCDENRQFTLRDEDYTAPGSTLITAGDNLIDGTERMSRETGQWFDALVVRYRYRNARGVDVERVDAASSVTNYTRIREIIRENVAYPGKGFAAYALRRAKQRGRVVEADIYPTWAEVCEQDVTVTPEAPRTPLTGLISRVRYDIARGVASITTRGLEL